VEGQGGDARPARRRLCPPVRCRCQAGHSRPVDPAKPSRDGRREAPPRARRPAGAANPRPGRAPPSVPAGRTSRLGATPGSRAAGQGRSLDHRGRLAPERPAPAFVSLDRVVGPFRHRPPETIVRHFHAAPARAVQADESGASRQGRPSPPSHGWADPSPPDQGRRRPVIDRRRRYPRDRTSDGLASPWPSTPLDRARHGSMLALMLPRTAGASPERPGFGVSAHSPHFSAPDFRGDYGEYGVYERPIGWPPVGRASMRHTKHRRVARAPHAAHGGPGGPIGRLMFVAGRRPCLP
jgi:hypothetical protein